ncbi:MAG: aspartyl-phosphate phosphatase Spo0E family protein [Clostridiales bacterium]|jgi:plasmid maintenance system antidote protein VapI|nr:aspartyl-phosphate phosphatase Spo0E family protein [Clostridiales bacterium]
MKQLEELIEKIEILRNQIHELIQQQGITNPDILRTSQQLDQLLVEYYKLINADKED